MPTYIPALSGIAVFQGRSNTTQTIATAGAVTPINLQAEDFDDLNGHSTSTNTSRYVIQRAGLYSVTGTAFVGATTTLTAGTQYRIAAIMKNGAYIPGASTWAMYTVSNSAIHITITPILITCALNDYIEVCINSGLANTVMAGDANNGSILRLDFIR